MAAIGIVFKANMFITFLQMGLANGVQPLGYNYGSGDHKRFVSVERYTKKCCVIVGILATALFLVLREPIIRLFISDGEVVYYGVKMLIAYMLSGGHRAVICQYELYAVSRKFISGDDTFRYASGTASDTAFVPVKCVYGVKRCHLRTGIDGLCSSYFVGCFMEENQKTD